MKKFALLSVLLLAGATAAAFAQGSTGTSATGTIESETVITGTTGTGIIMTTWAILVTDDVSNGFTKIRGTWKLINEDFWFAKKFFQKGLSGDILSWSKVIIKEKNTAIKELNKELKSAINSSWIIDWDSFAQKFTDIYTAFKTNAVPYINPAKLESFNRYIDGKIAAVKKNLEYRKNIITKREIAHQKKLQKKTALEKIKAEKKTMLEKAKADKKELKKNNK